MKKYIYIFLLFTSNIFGQNLVLNPSFEKTKFCKQYTAGFDRTMEDWSTATWGSSDVYNRCHKGQVGVPENVTGFQNPKHGDNYVGFLAYYKKNHREYLQGKLSEPLVKDSTYYFSFYTSLAENSTHAVKNLDVLFTDRKLKLRIFKPITVKDLEKEHNLRYNLVLIHNQEYYNDKKKWREVKLTYKALGGEQFFTIGNFYKNKKTDNIETPEGVGSYNAYYYVDEVSILPKYPKKEKKVKLIPEGKEVFTTNKTYIFENVTFDFDSFKLTEAAKSEIQEVFDYLKTDEQLRIKITGHTDNLGKEDFNQKLSENRAKAVANYLMELGVSEDRVSSKGLGEKEPITTNDTEEGREQNRRVAFEFIK
ncbi:OmpA family protein [Aureivirga sp. CE67]|uniref:OmpA family protein n=1 Tax=Aureivirga sp. CE67 TaxID=1788983 RepID=UPI0018CB177A|nr:OmpA family protein [Aureivirga sp. CE67]